MMHILMIAAENGALEGCKVGGIGDVVREAPKALAEQGCRVSVVTPAYGFLHHKAGDAQPVALAVQFRGEKQTVRCYAVSAGSGHPGVTHFVMDSPYFNAFDPVLNTHKIYIDDPPDQPFASDATKFALFCLAAAEAIRLEVFKEITHVHLHDWHAAFLLLLREYHPGYRFLRKIPAVYTIHNLGLQGIRPFSGHDSSLNAWYPGLHYDWLALKDPRWDCINPMAVGIRLADRVHTVSPSYAQEVLRPSDPPHSYGGEGLENDLQSATNDGRLFGILNGCDDGKNEPAAKPAWTDFVRLLKQTVLTWGGMTDTVLSQHFTAFGRLGQLGESPQRPGVICTSVGRLQEQKLLLMKEKGTQSVSGLERLLDLLGDRGLLVLLGSGDPDYERFFARVSARRENFLFLNGYSDACATALYATGDLFVMPSSYEPCGISQMLAMRAGQPCLVHAVGGLRDTVKDGHNGFVFQGRSITEQVDRMVSAFEAALALMTEAPSKWQAMRRHAAASRFPWRQSTEMYMKQLYT